MKDGHLLEVEGLRVSFGPARAVDGVDFTMKPGEIVGMVGESGSGKSLTALAVMGLLPSSSRREGRILWSGRELTEKQARRVRGREIGMVFQEPMSSLNPVFPVGFQVAEVLEEHEGLSRKEASARAVGLLQEVGISAASERARSYPHEISGGMKQRVLIAMATACRTKLLLADEPTTALDVTIQAQILSLLRELRARLGMAILLVSHDMGVIASTADRVLVMRAGKIVEAGGVREVFGAPRHPYTRLLLSSVPRIDTRPDRPDAANERPTVLELRDVSKNFSVGKRTLRALRGVSLELAPGESLGIVGESGCGKTTLARIALRLTPPSGGTIRFDGADVTDASERSFRPSRRHVQAVFQDPYSSLNPRMRVGDIVGEPLRAFGFSSAAREARVNEVLRTVGLSSDSAESFPHAFSGGQRQRIAIARALAIRPKLLVCDEAVSALDVSIQAQILNLLRDVQAEYGLSLLFISHNLAVVRHLCHRIAVMHLGEVVELARESDLFDSPRHPYTRALLASVPEPSPGARRPAPLPGEIPSPLDPPSGCGFRTRCGMAREECSSPPPMLEAAPSHWVRCPFT
jgi:oligopeptide/dipeptide ABC transporter ATP-binding protein